MPRPKKNASATRSSSQKSPKITVRKKKVKTKVTTKSPKKTPKSRRRKGSSSVKKSKSKTKKSRSKKSKTHKTRRSKRAPSQEVDTEVLDSQDSEVEIDSDSDFNINIAEAMRRGGIESVEDAMDAVEEPDFDPSEYHPYYSPLISPAGKLDHISEELSQIPAEYLSQIPGEYMELLSLMNPLPQFDDDYDSADEADDQDIYGGQEMVYQISHELEPEAIVTINTFLDRIPEPYHTYEYLKNFPIYQYRFLARVERYVKKHGSLPQTFLSAFCFGLIVRKKNISMSTFIPVLERLVEYPNQVVGPDIYYFLTEAEKSDIYNLFIRKYVEKSLGKITLDHEKVLSLLDNRCRQKRDFDEATERVLLKVVNAPFYILMSNMCVECQYYYIGVKMYTHYQLALSEQMVPALLRDRENQLIRLLIQYNYRLEPEHLWAACQEKNYEMVELFLDYGLVPDEKSLLSLLNIPRLPPAPQTPIEGEAYRMTEKLFFRMIKEGAQVTKNVLLLSIPYRLEIPNLHHYSLMADEDIEDLCDEYQFKPASYYLSGAISDDHLEKKCSHLSVSQLKKMFKKHKFTPNTRCLQYACTNKDNREVIKYLLDLGVPPNFACISQIAEGHKNLGILGELIQRYKIVDQEREERLKTRSETIESLCQELHEVQSKPRQLQHNPFQNEFFQLPGQNSMSQNSTSQNSMMKPENPTSPKKTLKTKKKKTPKTKKKVRASSSSSSPSTRRKKKEPNTKKEPKTTSRSGRSAKK